MHRHARHTTVGTDLQVGECMLHGRLLKVPTSHLRSTVCLLRATRCAMNATGGLSSGAISCSRHIRMGPLRSAAAGTYASSACAESPAGTAHLAPNPQRTESSTEDVGLPAMRPLK